MKRLIVLAVLLVACSKDESPSSPGGGVPDIRGTYRSSRFLTMRVTQQSNGQVVTLTCPGRMTVASQLGGSFSGSMVWEIGGDCTTGTALDVSGEVRAGGAVTMAIARSGGSGDWTGALGCSVVTADPTFNGSLTGSRLTASAQALMQCNDIGRLQFNVTFDGTR